MRTYMSLRLGLVSIVSLLVLSSCQEWLGVNVNPNNPTDVPPNLVFISGQVTGAYELYGPINLSSSLWVQHWASTGAQYRQRDQYEVASNTFNNQWTAIYADILADFNYVVQASEELGASNYAAPARILRAYYFLLATEMWGDIPYTEALTGEDNIEPVYDSQADIYAGLLNDLDAALAEISEEGVTYEGLEDVMYGGDMDSWRRFANTLKLKIYMRHTNADLATARQGVTSILNSDAPLIMSNDQDGEVPFFEANQNRNPQWEQNRTRPTDFGPSNTLLGIMRDLEDPRITVYFEPFNNYDPAVDTDSIRGEVNGLNANDLLADTDDYSRLAEPFRAEAKSSVLLANFERAFLEAEAVVRGWAEGNAAELYAEAVAASMTKYGLTEADASAYVADGQPAAFPIGGDETTQLRAIYLQKYIALFSMGQEAYTEWRRTGVPALSPAENSNIGPQIITRYPYADDELSKNPNTPGITLTDKLYFAL